MMRKQKLGSSSRLMTSGEVDCPNIPGNSVAGVASIAILIPFEMYYFM